VRGRGHRRQRGHAERPVPVLTTPSPIRLLFVHGLESHPNGSKTRILREQGFEVVAPDMHMGLFQLRRRNSALRQLPRLKETRLALAGVALGLAVAGASASGLGIAALGVAWGVSRRKALLARALGRSFDACVTIVRQALTEAQPDIVVGSSWGGAVAADLLVHDLWTGPTVLLAPAIRRVCVRARRGDGSKEEALLRARSQRAPIVIFHDPSDDTVPHQDSVELARGSAIDLRSVDGGGHRLLALLERGELADELRRLAAR